MSDLIQGTEEWKAARAGCVTASRIHAVRMKESTAGYRNYFAQLVVERLTGKSADDTYQSKAMERGLELEAEARVAYEFLTGTPVKETGFVRHPDIEWSGASPDGLVNEDGLVQVKCPNAANHLNLWLGADLDPEYWEQCQWEMECSGRDWNDYVSYHPDFPDHLRLYLKHIERDEKWLAETRILVAEFSEKVAETVRKLA